jgi:hypothetical protein
LKAVKLDYVSSHLLKELFAKIPNNELDFELLEAFKNRLTPDYTNLEILSKRWTKKPKILSEKEIKELFQSLISHFGEQQNPFLQIQLLIDQINQQKLEIESLKEKNNQKDLQINQATKEIQEIKTFTGFHKIIPFQNDHTGLLQDLKKTDPSTVSSRSISVHCEHKHEHLLIYDNQTLFHSNGEPNSWFSVQVKSKKIIPSGYLLRSWTNYPCTPKTWKLEGSIDNQQWAIIDQQNNRDWRTKEWSEVYFPVQTKQAFSIFKFTQTGTNYQNDNWLVLNYFEIFGAILDQ